MYLPLALHVRVKKIMRFEFAANIFDCAFAGNDFKLRKQLVDEQISIGQKHITACKGLCLWQIILWKCFGSIAKYFLFGIFDQLLAIASRSGSFLRGAHLCQFNAVTDELTKAIINCFQFFFPQA